MTLDLLFIVSDANMDQSLSLETLKDRCSYKQQARHLNVLLSSLIRTDPELSCRVQTGVRGRDHITPHVDCLSVSMITFYLSLKEHQDGPSSQLSPTPSHSLLQAPIMSHDASHQSIRPCHWLDNSGCQAPTSAYTPPPPSLSLYGNPAPTTPPTCIFPPTPGWDSYYGNLYPFSSSSVDWVLPGSLPWGRSGLPGEVSTHPS